MSDASEYPDAAAGADADAWATACEEDLAAERERRRAEYGPQPVSAAEELRKLADAVTAKVAEIGKPLGGTAGGFAAQGFAQQLLTSARSVVEPVVERNPQVFDHLAAAGGELVAAYRAAVQGQEQRWSSDLRPEDAADPAAGAGEAARGGPGRGDGPGGSTGRDDGEGGSPGPERIDLD